MSNPSTSGSMARGDLLEEVQQQQRREAAEASRARAEEVRNQRAAQRARVRNRVLAVLGLIAVLGLVAFGVKRFVEQRRIDEGLAFAADPLAASTVAKLEAARAVLESNLDVAPDHPETLGRLALVVTHLHVRGVASLDDARAAALRAKLAGRAEGPLSEGMLAAQGGDFDQARRAYEGAEVEDPWVEADAAWLQAVVALGHPYDQGLEDAAIARLEASLDETPWMFNHRALASLRGRRGEFELALKAIESAELLAADEPALAVDELLFERLRGETEPAATAIRALERVVLAADRGRLAVVRGLVGLRKGDEAAGIEALRSAWGMTSARDTGTRVLILEVLLGHGKVEIAETLRREVYLGSQGDTVVDAWIDLARGRTKDALGALESMPQAMARVAHLQALALVEEHRFPEALPWIDFARARLPARGDLAVAAARVSVVSGTDRANALMSLETIAEEQPWTYRVWTGLGEARLSMLDAGSPDPERAEAAKRALETAMVRELAPAEAAYRLARNSEAEIFEEPETAKAVLDLYRQAATTPPELGLHRAAYGAFLARLARARESRDVLIPLVDDAALGPDPLLELGRVSSTDALLRGSPVDERVRGWLDEAERRGADPPALALERARYDLARRNPQALQRARTRLASLVELEPRNVEARALFATTLLASNEVAAARVTLTEGIRRTLRSRDGRLYVVRARAEIASQRKRKAASLAYRGWRKMVREPGLPVGALLDTAPFVAGLWTDLGQPKAAATIGRGLTLRAPASPRAWVLRGGIELAGERAGAACNSADKAIELDEALPSGWALRGDCLMALEAYSEAVDSFDRAVRLAEGTVLARPFRAKLDAARRAAEREGPAQQ